MKSTGKFSRFFTVSSSPRLQRDETAETCTGFFSADDIDNTLREFTDTCEHPEAMVKSKSCGMVRWIIRRASIILASQSTVSTMYAHVTCLTMNPTPLQLRMLSAL